MNALAPGTAWSAGRLDGAAGPQLVLFGRMYEDWRIEQSAFAPRARVFCIASAGCTAMRLAPGREVVAVDINPAQLAYAARRIGGAPPVEGTAERLMRFGRPLLALAGWSRSRLRHFLDLDDPLAQIATWKRDFDTRRFRAGMQVLFAAATLRAGYSSALVASLPRDFASVMRRRMERCFATHPNRDNPFARALLLGESADDAPMPGGAPIELVCADAAQYLERAPERSFDAFTLSNITDGAELGYRERLFGAVRRAARPGAVVVTRSFAEPPPTSSSNQAREDRSMLWGVVDVVPADALR